MMVPTSTAFVGWTCYGSPTMMCWPANLALVFEVGIGIQNYCYGISLLWEKHRIIWKSALFQKTSNRSLMCKYPSTSSDAVPLSKTNSVNALCCRYSLSADFIFLYPFALLKLWLHVVLDSLFSLVVISALYLIRVSAFLQDKLSDVRKAYGILENTSISTGNMLTFMHMCVHSHGNWHTAFRHVR